MSLYCKNKYFFPYLFFIMNLIGSSIYNTRTNNWQKLNPKILEYENIHDRYYAHFKWKTLENKLKKKTYRRL